MARVSSSASQVLGSDEDGRRLTVDGHGYPLVLVVYPANELGQVRLDVTQRQTVIVKSMTKNLGDVKIGSLGTARKIHAQDYKQEAGSLFGSGL